MPRLNGNRAFTAQHTGYCGTVLRHQPQRLDDNRQHRRWRFREFAYPDRERRHPEPEQTERRPVPEANLQH